MSPSVGHRRDKDDFLSATEWRARGLRWLLHQSFRLYNRSSASTRAVVNADFRPDPESSPR
jgi:hypothetical protein